MITADTLQNLMKALEAGTPDAAPSSLTQGGALQRLDQSPVFTNVCFQNKHIKFQKDLTVEKTRLKAVQFRRQLSYGSWGRAATLEGGIGQEETSVFVSAVVPMASYAHNRRWTLEAQLVETIDGKTAEDRSAEDAALLLAGGIEWDLYSGKSDFSNAGVFDGNPLVLPDVMPGIKGVDLQVRESDLAYISRDQMFGAYGSDLSMVINGGLGATNSTNIQPSGIAPSAGTLTQFEVDQAHLRVIVNHGEAEELHIDPFAFQAYNVYIYTLQQRNPLMGQKLTRIGGDIGSQDVSVGGNVKMVWTNFLRPKFRPDPARTGPVAPTLSAADGAAASTPFLATQVYKYVVTGANENGESEPTAETSFTVVTSGHATVLTITQGASTARWFNVYRTPANITAASRRRFIGRVKASGGATTTFTDLDNKRPGSSKAILLDKTTMRMHELMPFTKVRLAVSDLSEPMCYARFCTLAVERPRQNAIIDNLIGNF